MAPRDLERRQEIDELFLEAQGDADYYVETVLRERRSNARKRAKDKNPRETNRMHRVRYGAQRVVKIAPLSAEEIRAAHSPGSWRAAKFRGFLGFTVEHETYLPTGPDWLRE